MKNLTWQNPEQLFVAQELINKVKSKCCGIKGNLFYAYLSALSPTLNINVDDIRAVPYIEDSKEEIINLVQNCITISKQDWDAHETSWIFLKQSSKDNDSTPIFGNLLEIREDT